MSSSARWPPAVTSAGSPARPRTSAAVLDACGFGLVFIETVGTGQSEVEVASIADTTVVVQAPEMGDEVQAMKAGLLEVADLVVVNKADRPGAERAAAQLRSMLSLGASPTSPDAARPRPKHPEVLLASGLEASGVPELLAALDAHHAARDAPTAPMPRASRGRAPRSKASSPIAPDALVVGTTTRETDALVERVAAHELDPYAAADALRASL